ncbi:MAG: hypothetical protein ACKVI7_10290 [Rhodobacterales bacterium]
MTESAYVRGSRLSVAEPPSMPTRKVPPFLGEPAAYALENMDSAAVTERPVMIANCIKSRRDTPEVATMGSNCFSLFA